MSGLEDATHLDWEIMLLHRQGMARMLCSCHLHAGQPPILLMLRHMGACKQAELARAMRVTPATITVSLRRMEKSGLVCRIPDPDDLRSNRIELTDEGEKAAAWADCAIRKINAQKYAGFTAAEFSQLTQFYRRMRQNLSEFDSCSHSTND